MKYNQNQIFSRLEVEQPVTSFSQKIMAWDTKGLYNLFLKVIVKKKDRKRVQENEWNSTESK